jgi:hypothetical protein
MMHKEITSLEAAMTLQFHAVAHGRGPAVYPPLLRLGGKGLGKEAEDSPGRRHPRQARSRPVKAGPTKKRRVAGSRQLTPRPPIPRLHSGQTHSMLRLRYCQPGKHWWLS